MEDEKFVTEASDLKASSDVKKTDVESNTLSTNRLHNVKHVSLTSSRQFHVGISSEFGPVRCGESVDPATQFSQFSAKNRTQKRRFIN